MITLKATNQNNKTSQNSNYKTWSCDHDFRVILNRFDDFLSREIISGKKKSELAKTFWEISWFYESSTSIEDVLLGQKFKSLSNFLSSNELILVK